MQVSVESTSALERRMTVGVPAERIETEVNKRLQQTARRAKIPGFRPGKVPMSVIRQRYEASARQEAMGDLIQETFYEAVVEQKLNPVGSPSVEPKSFEKGKDLEYIATFEVFPEFTVSGLEDIKIERLQAEVSDADVDNMLDVLRKQNTRFEVVERAAQNDDQLNIDFVGKIDGEAFAGGSAKGTLLVLGSGRMIAGFEEGLVGAKAGEERVLNLTFPEDYQNLDLANKAAEFTVTVNSVAEPKLPELNEEFFALFGVKETGLDGFRAEVQKNMERELRQAIKSKVKNQVMEGLLQANPIEVPKALIGNEVNRLRVQAVQQFGGNIKPDQLPVRAVRRAGQAPCGAGPDRRRSGQAARAEGRRRSRSRNDRGNGLGLPGARAGRRLVLQERAPAERSPFCCTGRTSRRYCPAKGHCDR